MKNNVIAIDGPSGSGKSSTARGVASRLGWQYLDTGAMYRAATWRALDARVPLDDSDALADCVRDMGMVSVLDPEKPQIFVDGVDVTAEIREPRIASAVSALATNAAVRQNLVERQQQIIAASDGIVVEGRDITTVVAPDAGVRVLLQADPRARVARRAAESGGDATAVEALVVGRDAKDSLLVEFQEPAPGVMLIDSTNMTLKEVIDSVCWLQQRETEQ